MDSPLLRVDSVSKSFGGFTALYNVTIDIRPGERFGLIGPNGSGKTTLVETLVGQRVFGLALGYEDAERNHVLIENLFAT